MLSPHRSPDISLETLSGWIQDILSGINDIKKVLQLMSTATTTLDTEIAQLTSDVAEETTANASAITLLSGLSTQLQAALAQAATNGATPLQLQALQAFDTSLQANTASLAAAVQQNTPGGPVTPGASGTNGASGASGSASAHRR